MKQKNTENMNKANDSAYDPNDELRAEIMPISRGALALRIGLIVLAAAVITAGLIIGIRTYRLAQALNSAKTAVHNAFDEGNAEFELSFTSQTESGFTARGAFKTNKDSSSLALCSDINYGDRMVEMQLSTVADDAYIYLASDTDTELLHTNIAVIRYMLGYREANVDWSSVISSLAQSGGSDDLNKYYDTSKISEATENINKLIGNPFKLSGMLEYSYKDNTYSFTIDTYKLMKELAECMRPVFKQDTSYENLISVIEDEKEALKKQYIFISVKENEGTLEALTLRTELIHTEASFFNAGEAIVNVGYTKNPEQCNTVSIDTAYNRLKRLGLDTQSAYKAAKRALNSFAEKFSYDIAENTIVLLRDSYNNEFAFAYKNYELNEIEYGTELYGAWNTTDYISLNTSDIDSEPYVLGMYEPKKVANEGEKGDDYNYAYLAALQAMQAVVSSGYKMTENAVFVVIENDAEYQFIYQDGSLYDVIEQYYYYVYTGYGQADIEGVSGVPENVTLYIPNTEAE